MPEIWNDKDPGSIIVELPLSQNTTIEERTDGCLINFHPVTYDLDRVTHRIFPQIGKSLMLSEGRKNLCLLQIAESISKEQSRDKPTNLAIHFNPDELIGMRMSPNGESTYLRLADIQVAIDTFLILLPHTNIPNYHPTYTLETILPKLGLVEKSYLELLRNLIPPENTRTPFDSYPFQYFKDIHQVLRELSKPL